MEFVLLFLGIIFTLVPFIVTAIKNDVSGDVERLLIGCGSSGCILITMGVFY